MEGEEGTVGITIDISLERCRGEGSGSRKATPRMNAGESSDGLMKGQDVVAAPSVTGYPRKPYSVEGGRHPLVKLFPRILAAFTGTNGAAIVDIAAILASPPGSAKENLP